MTQTNNYRKGLLCSLTCNLLWGFLPIYWSQLEPVSSFTILFYRVVLMYLICFAFCAYTLGSFKRMYRPMFESKKSFFTFLAAGAVITLNWGLYIWSVANGYLIQSSMGYFLDPLIVCLLGRVIYRENLNNWKKTAIGFAVIGLLVMIIGYRQVPVIAVCLGGSFAAYAAIKKSVHLHPLQSLLFETTFTAPVFLFFIFYLEFTGQGALQYHDMVKFGLLLLAGVATVTPMAFFSKAAQCLPLVTLGLMDYSSPTISLFLGIFLFREPFDLIQFSAFVFIWIGLAFFTYGEVREQKKQALAARSNPAS